MRRRLVIALCWWFSSCSAETSGPQESTSATPRFVAFRQRAIFINRLDTPIQPPYATGSTPSADLLRSSDPAIVELDGYGNLIAHKEGQAVIRGSGSAVLEVTVRAPTRLELVPRRIELGLGQKGNVEVRSEGKTLPPESLRWQTTDPNIAAAFGSIVQAGMSAGTVTLTCTVGGASASAEVVVREPDAANLRVEPSRLTVSVGATPRLRVANAYANGLTWTSNNAAVLQPVRDGLFLARAAGHAKACAIYNERRSCATVSVMK